MRACGFFLCVCVCCTNLHAFIQSCIVPRDGRQLHMKHFFLIVCFSVPGQDGDAARTNVSVDCVSFLSFSWNRQGWWEGLGGRDSIRVMCVVLCVQAGQAERSNIIVLLDSVPLFYNYKKHWETSCTLFSGPCVKLVTSKTHSAPKYLCSCLHCFTPYHPLYITLYSDTMTAH